MRLFTLGRACWLVLALTLGIAVGCSPGAGGGNLTVSGKVTYEGQEIEHGQISFIPTDDKGSAAGTSINNGKYTITGLAAGKKRVMITAEPKERKAPPKSMDEMADQMQAPKAPPGSRPPPKSAGGAKVMPPPPESEVPADAVGNGQEVTISGSQSDLNFDLKKPAAKEPAAKRK